MAASALSGWHPHNDICAHPLIMFAIRDHRK